LFQHRSDTVLTLLDCPSVTYVSRGWKFQSYRVVPVEGPKAGRRITIGSSVEEGSLNESTMHGPSKEDVQKSSGRRPIRKDQAERIHNGAHVPSARRRAVSIETDWIEGIVSTNQALPYAIV
jgi:hypothetical protein